MPTTVASPNLNSFKYDIPDTLSRFVWTFSRSHQIVLCCFAVLISIINLVPLELQRRTIDQAIANQNLDLLFVLAATYIAVILGLQISKFGFRLYQSWVAENTIKRLRRDVVKTHRKFSGADRGDNDSNGSVVTIVNAETEVLGTFAGENVSDAFSNLAMLVGVWAYMFIVEPKVALIAIIFFIPQIILAPLMQKFLNRLVKNRVKLMRSFGDGINDEAVSISSLRKFIASIYSNRMRFSAFKYFLKGVINMLNALGPIVVLFYGGYLAINGETTAGVIVAFLSGFNRVSGPIRGLINFYRTAAQADVQRHMLFKWALAQKGNG